MQIEVTVFDERCLIDVFRRSRTSWTGRGEYRSRSIFADAGLKRDVVVKWTRLAREAAAKINR